jgi:hypothetical protein
MRVGERAAQREARYVPTPLSMGGSSLRCVDGGSVVETLVACLLACAALLACLRAARFLLDSTIPPADRPTDRRPPVSTEY